MSKTPDEMRAALAQPFPKEAVKQRVGGGGSRFDYIEGFTVIHRLNDATGGAWDWTIRSFEFRPLSPLTDRRTGELKEQSLVVVTGELTIPGLGTRAGIGVQKVSENGGEDLVKGASTDALKKAATLFGVALSLYGPDYGDNDLDAARFTAAEFTTPQPANQPARPARTPPPPPGPRPAAAPQGGGPPPPAPEPPYTDREFDAIKDKAWGWAEDGWTLEDIRNDLNKLRHRMSKEQRQEVVTALAKIEAQHYAPASIAG